MLRFTRRCGGGGHHGIPTTKEAAHLTQEWIMSRKVPPAPGVGKRFASFTYPSHRTKYQFNAPEQHEVRVVNLRGPTDKFETSRKTRLSETAIDAITADLGLTALPKPVERVADEPPVVAKKTSVSSIADRMTFDFNESNDYLGNRGCLLSHRLKDFNPRGHEREMFPWVEKPFAAPAPPPPKK